MDLLPPFKKELMNNSLLTKRLQNTQVQSLIAHNEKEPIVKDQQENIGSISPSSNPGFNVENLDKIGDMLSKTNPEGNPYADHIIFQKNPNGFAFIMNKYPEEAKLLNREMLTQNFDMFKSLLTNTQGGIIYNDPNNNFTVDIKIKPSEKGLLMAMLTFISNTGKLEDIELHTINSIAGIKLNISKVKYPQDDKSFPQIILKMTLQESFNEPLQVGLKARIGSMKVDTYFALPVLINKFIEPYEMSIENYTGMWYEISNSPDEKCHKLDSVLYNPMQNSPIADFLRKFASLLNSLNFKIFPPTDVSNFHEIEGIAVFNLDNISIPILAQVSFVPSYSTEFRFSLRCKVPNSDRFYGLLLDLYSIVKFFIHKS